MKKQSRSDNHKTVTSVLAIFQDLNKNVAPSKTQIFELVRLFRDDHPKFEEAMEMAYLKIFKTFHEKSNKKIPNKYEELAESLFKELLAVKQSREEWTSALGQFFSFFLKLLAEAIYSSIMNIKIMSARMLFLLLKQLPSPQAYLNATAKTTILRSVYYLVRLKVSTYKQIGVKLASIVLHWPDKFVQKIEKEMFKILSVDQNQQIRKMVITNLVFRSENIDRVLCRLRDKNAEVRAIIVRKLSGERYSLNALSQSHIYKLLYDGYGNKQLIVQKETLKYFAQYFTQTNQNSMQTQNRFQQFITIFQPQLLLINSHLYTLFDMLISELIDELPENMMVDYARKLCLDVKGIARGGARGEGELVWLKGFLRCANRNISGIVEESGPSGTEMAKILLDLVKKEDIYAIYEILQFFTLQKTPDEIGRNKMFDSLKTILHELSYFELQPNYEKISSEDDICTHQHPTQLKQKKLLLSYYDIPIITCSYDLIYQIGQSMKSLRPEYYEIELKQIMSEWNNPQQNTLKKEQQLTNTNILKLQQQNQPKNNTLNLIGNLKNKLSDITFKIQRQQIKSRMIIMTLSRVKYNSKMDDYLAIIKNQLTKEDQSYGLLLLGMYVLEGVDKVEQFWPVYWGNLVKGTKINLLVSLKVTTDLINKFNLLSPQSFLNTSEQHNPDQYVKKLLELVIHKDGDIRILAIECICRMIYHNRVDESNISLCFLYLLLLWWETSSEEVSAKSVHTISMFIKNYIEKGNAEVKRLCEMLCIFFRLLFKFQQQKKSINKQLISYNLKMEEFIKRIVVIAMTVLKYHKQSRQIIWKYESEAQLGPQELFLIYLLHQEGYQHILERVFNICDFYEDAPLETLIFVKKEIQRFNQHNSVSKKYEQVLNKFQEELETKISVKNQSFFNEDLLEGIQKEFHEHEIIIEEEARRMAKNITESNIFVESKELNDSQSDSISNSDSQNEQDLIKEIDQEMEYKSQSAPNVRQAEERSKIEERRKKDIVPEPDPQEKYQRRNKKKVPQPIDLEDSEEEAVPKKEQTNNQIARRTRNRHKV